MDGKGIDLVNPFVGDERYKRMALEEKTDLGQRKGNKERWRWGDVTPKSSLSGVVLEMKVGLLKE